MKPDQLAFLALYFIPGIGDATIRQLIGYCGSAEEVFKTRKGKLLHIPGIGEATARAILKGKSLEEAEKEWALAEKANVRIVLFTDTDYPLRLRQIPDAPAVLYIKGNVNLEAAKIVAIVGTRNATDYGKYCVEQLVAGLVPHQALILSGLAYGIDIHAHQIALDHQLPTVGVLGSGIDVIYPYTHREIVKKMLAAGGLLSEHRMGTKPDAHHFPARNRIVAALADAVVIVEAAEKGGALITAEIANSYHKDVFAFPGDVGRIYSAGCNNLIKSNKAHLITSVDDLAYLMNWQAHATLEKTSPVTVELNNAERKIFDLLGTKQELSIDELSWQACIPVNRLAGILLELEFKQIITALPGNRFKRKEGVRG